MRTFVMTDIHGNQELFRKALKSVGLKKSDKLILLGDLIDRGHDSKGVLDTIFLLLENGFSIECLMGNHEQMFLDAFLNTDDFNQWMINGGDKTLLSFLTSSIEKIPVKYTQFIKSFKYYLEYKDFIFVHAALNMRIHNPFEDIHTILWERNAKDFASVSWLRDRTLIHGHTPSSKDVIQKAVLDKSRIIGIDNGVYLKKTGFGELCILELEKLEVRFII